MNKITILLFLICYPISNYGFSQWHYGKYVPIDSLSQQDAGRLVMLDIRDRKIDFPIDGRTITFVQKAKVDSIGWFTGSTGQSLFGRLEDGLGIVLNVSELLRVENDSIFISATYLKFNERGNIGRTIGIDSLAVCKSELLGVMISVQSVTEIRQAQRRFGWFVGILTAVIGVLGILALTSN